MPYDLTIGDMLRKARRTRRLSQGALGKKAKDFPLGGRSGPIGKNTVSKAENDPWSSELATIWRLLAAAGLTFTEVERLVRPWGPVATSATSSDRARAIATLADSTVPQRTPAVAPHAIRTARRNMKSRKA